ncbi:MAG: hypothetical protein OQJ98_02605 [Candidatus Pacebacteria bacterium]|nr:hypothetical protein [Candidatus Paceibacterota bacterium]
MKSGDISAVEAALGQGSLRFPLLLVPAGLGDDTCLEWLVTNMCELRNVFSDVLRESYDDTAIMVSRAGWSGDHWNTFREPDLENQVRLQ